MGGQNLSVGAKKRGSEFLLIKSAAKAVGFYKLIHNAAGLRRARFAALREGRKRGQGNSLQDQQVEEEGGRPHQKVEPAIEVKIMKTSFCPVRVSRESSLMAARAKRSRPGKRKSQQLGFADKRFRTSPFHADRPDGADFAGPLLTDMRRVLTTRLVTQKRIKIPKKSRNRLSRNIG